MSPKLRSKWNSLQPLDSVPTNKEPTPTASTTLSPVVRQSTPFRIEGFNNLQHYIDSSPLGPSFADGEDHDGRQPWELVQIKYKLAQNALLRRPKPLRSFSQSTSARNSSSAASLPYTIPEADQRQCTDAINLPLVIPPIRLANISGPVISTEGLDDSSNSDTDTENSSTETFSTSDNPVIKQSKLATAHSYYNKGKSQASSTNFYGRYISIPGVLPTITPVLSPKSAYRVGNIINAVDITRHDPLRSYLSSKTADIVATANAYVQTRRRYLIVLQINCAFMVCATLTHHGNKGLRNRDLAFRSEHMAIEPLGEENLSGYSKVLRVVDNENNPLDENSYVWFTRTTITWFSDPCIAIVGRLTEDSIKELLFRYHGKFMSVQTDEVEEARPQKISYLGFGANQNGREKQRKHSLERLWRSNDDQT